MAAIIQLRRGSTPSSLSYGEIYVNDDSASLALRLSGSGDIVTLAKLEQKNHGNIWIDGDITASSISASGDIRIGGQLFLGDEAGDSIVVQGSLSSSLIPETTAVHDLGSSTKKWKDLYIGAIYGTTISVTGQTLVSGSGQVTAFGFISGSDLNSLNSYTSSTDVRLSNLQSTTASLNTRVTQLETDTGSQDQRLDRLELETGSLNTTNTAQNLRLTSLETNTGSLGGDVTTINNRLGNIETTTASLNINITNLHSTTASLNTFQSAATIRLNNMESTTSSFDQRLGRLQLETASIDTRIDGIDTVTASLDGRLDVEEGKSTTLATVTSSLDGRLDNVETTTASLDGRLDNVETTTSSINQQIGQIESFTSSFNTAITLNSDDVTVLGNLTVQGTQTQLNTSTLNIEDKNLLIASGAADSSAANGAGITIDGADKTLTWDHSNSNFVFNARVSSSVGFAGDGSNLTGLTADSVAFGNVTSKPTLISGSSQIDHDATTNFVAGEHFLQSAITTVGTIGTGVWQGTAIDKTYLDDEVLNTSLNSYTASNDTAATVQNNRLSNLESTTASLDQRLDRTELETASIDQRLDRLQLETGSLNTSVTTINGRLSNVETTTSSFDGRLDNLQTTTESFDQRLDRIELYTSSNDTGSFNARFTNIESTTSSFDSRLDQLETNTGSLGTAAFFNVTSSIFGDATVVPTAQAVNNAIASSGGGDITAVAAGLGMSGGGVTGDVTLNLNTGSTHFTQGVSAASGVSSLNSYTASNDIKITNIHSTTASFDSRLDNIEGASGSYLTAHPSITQGSNISQDNSNGTVLQDLTITLDSNGHVTTATAGTVNLDGRYYTETELDAGQLDTRYYTETESDTLFTKKLGLGVVSGSSQVSHDSTTGFVANEHIDHSNVSITAGTGLNGGGDITTTRTLNVDNDYKNTSLNSFTSSFNTSMSIDASGVTVLGNLTVQGTQTILDTTTLNVKDKNILVASGAADSAAADGAGLTIGGANESLTWVHADSRFSFSDDLNVGGNITVTGTVDGRDLQTDGTKLDGIEASADVTDTGNVHPIIDAKGIISGSSQVDHDATTNFVAGEHFLQSAITTVGTVTSGNVTAILPSGVVSGSSQVGINNNEITITVDGGLTVTADADFTLNQSSDQTINIGTGGSGFISGSGGVTAAGALMDSELSSVASVKAINQGLATTDEPQFNKLGVGGDSDATYELKVTGDIGATGDIVAFVSSDERLKNNIKPIEGALDKVSQISGNTFDWNEEKQDIYKGKDYGVIAQEIKEVMPELVDTRDNGYLAVKYDKIVPLLIESIKELKKEIEELKSK